MVMAIRPEIREQIVASIPMGRLAQAPGDRGGGRVPRLRGGRLHHRRQHLGEWRHAHDVDCADPGRRDAGKMRQRNSGGGIMAAKKVAVVTGGMGGLGETIATKMADAGYRVVVTYSPGNTKHTEWLAADEGATATTSSRVPCDVADYDSCARAVAEVQGKVGRDRHPGQQRRHHARHDLQEDGQGQLGRGHAHQPRQPVQHDQAGRRRHGRARLGPGHQRRRRSTARRARSARPTIPPPRPAMHGFTKALALEVREEGRHRQHDLARLHRHQDGHRDPEGDPRHEDPAADPGRPARQARGSRRPDHLSRAPTRRRSSPAPTSPSTAASTCIKE